MEKENVKRFRLEILTPTYIGGDENKNLSNKDYFIKENIINVIDTAKLMKFLVENNLYEKFIDGAKNNKKINEILKEINAKGYENEIVKEKLNIETIGYKKGNSTLNNIEMFIKDDSGNPYIPASTLKGFITNAIAYNYILDNKEKFKNIKNDIYRIRDTKDLRGKYNNIQKLVFKEKREKDGINYEVDLRQYIKISDGFKSNDVGTFITAKEDFSVKPKTAKVNVINIYREYLIPKATFEFDMCIDLKELKGLGINSISDILDMIQKYTTRCMELDRLLENVAEEKGIQIYRTINKKVPNIILGGGSGYYSKSLLTALFENQKDLIEIVKKILKKDNHMILDIVNSPRTLKLAKYNSKYYFVGMSRIEEI